MSESLRDQVARAIADADEHDFEGTPAYYRGLADASLSVMGSPDRQCEEAKALSDAVVDLLAEALKEGRTLDRDLLLAVGQLHSAHARFLPLLAPDGKECPKCGSDKYFVNGDECSQEAGNTHHAWHIDNNPFVQKMRSERASVPAEGEGEACLEIDADQFEKARKNPALQDFARQADKRIEELKKAGLFDEGVVTPEVADADPGATEAVRKVAGLLESRLGDGEGVEHWTGLAGEVVGRVQAAYSANETGREQRPSSVDWEVK